METRTLHNNLAALAATAGLGATGFGEPERVGKRPKRHRNYAKVARDVTAPAYIKAEEKRARKRAKALRDHR